MTSVYVITDSEGDVLGVASDLRNVKIGKATGLRVEGFVLNALHQVADDEYPFVVYFQDADENKVSIWPIKEGFPGTSATATPDGIEVIVYARNANEALAIAYGNMHFDSWDILVSDWEAQ